jgi:hypothetical protein
MAPKTQKNWCRAGTKIVVQAFAAGEFKFDAPIAEFKAVLPPLNPEYTNYQNAHVIKRSKERSISDDIKSEEKCNIID